jgi:imidazole glycerol-phosphate synthase subunit HisH
MIDVCVLDTGHANLTSVCRAVEEAGKSLSLRVTATRDPAVLRAADKIVFPGQGGFRDCLVGLGDENPGVLREKLAAGTPYFGICLGLQVLFESSEEAPGVKGLGLLSGGNARLREEPGIKIPHMGWNELETADHAYLRGAGGTHTWFYFVHSYHAVPSDASLVRAVVRHGSQQVTAAIAKDNLFATQFHPEKSQSAGLALLEAFLAS